MMNYVWSSYYPRARVGFSEVERGRGTESILNCVWRVPMPMAGVYTTRHRYVVAAGAERRERRGLRVMDEASRNNAPLSR